LFFLLSSPSLAAAPEPELLLPPAPNTFLNPAILIHDDPPPPPPPPPVSKDRSGLRIFPPAAATAALFELNPLPPL